MLSSLADLIFVFAVSPFEDRSNIEVFNEINVLLVGYCAVQILYASHTALMMQQVGSLMVSVILFGIIVNVVIITFGWFKDMKRLLLHQKQQQAVKRRNKDFTKIK